MELVYFDYDGGRGPICRIALAASGLRWTDVRLSDEEFMAAKSRGMYGGGLPVLKLPTGRVITQSAAIARFAAKHGNAGLYPADAAAALLVDELVDIAADALGNTPSPPDAALKAVQRKEYAAGKLRSYMDAFSDALAANGGPFVSGPRLTIADLAVDGVVGMIASGDYDHIPPGYVNEWPQLVAACRLVRNHPLAQGYYPPSQPAAAVSSVPYTMLGQHLQRQQQRQQAGRSRWLRNKLALLTPLAYLLAVVAAVLRMRRRSTARLALPPS